MAQTKNTQQNKSEVTTRSVGVQRIVMWAVGKWDWMIYRLAYSSLRRMCAKEPAFALILERWIQEWRKQNPMPEHLERSAEQFFEACRDHPSDGSL